MKVNKIIHEFGNNGRHRIVLQDDAGELHPGEWASYDAIAQNRGYFGTTEYWENELPVGIWTVNSKPHQTIT